MIGHICPIKSVHYRMTAPRRARGADAAGGSPRARSRCTRSSARRRPRSARSPSAPASAARPSTATSRTRTRCSHACSSHWRAANPPPDPARLVGDREPGRAHANGAPRAVRVLRPHRDDVRRACCATSRSFRPSSGGCSDFYGYLGAIQDILVAGRGLRGRRAQRTSCRDRPRARVPDVALAEPRAVAEQRRRRRAHVPARRGRRNLKGKGPVTRAFRARIRMSS